MKGIKSSYFSVIQQKGSHFCNSLPGLDIFGPQRERLLLLRCMVTSELSVGGVHCGGTTWSASSSVCNAVPPFEDAQLDKLVSIFLSFIDSLAGFLLRNV